MCLEIKKICKKHQPDIVVADAISFSLNKGELGALIGPSGCGKTTLLRMISGFEKPDSGAISIMGKIVSSDSVFIQPENRTAGMVFQDYALFPHLTVLKNIKFGLSGSDKRKNGKDVKKLLHITGLENLENKYPHELSGGQQQRVALARAIAPRPDILLLDEPFSNLDVSLRESLSSEVKHILNEFNMTGLLVTHNQQEAFAMADKTGVIMNGKLLQWDSADGLYYHPSSKEVAGFVGEGSVIKGHLTYTGKLETELGDFRNIKSFQEKKPGVVDVFIRPEQIVFNDQSHIKAKLIKSFFRGPGMSYVLELSSGHIITVLNEKKTQMRPGEFYGISPVIDQPCFFKGC